MTVERGRYESRMFRQGLLIDDHIPNWPEQRVRPLLDKFAELLQQQPLLFEVLPLICTARMRGALRE